MTSRAKTKNTAPISTHPAFPAVVALWFAALLGLGSLVIPVVVFEKIVTVTGLAAIGPFAPPLGTTSRLLIAGACTVIGAVAGIFLARRVALAQETAQLAALPEEARGTATGYAGSFGQRDDGAAAAPKKPISAREELGADSFDDPNGLKREDETPVPGFSDAGFGTATGARPIPGRRRPLSVTNENERSEFLDRAPVPGGIDASASGADTDLVLADEAPGEETASDPSGSDEPAYRDMPVGPLDLGDFSGGPYDAGDIEDEEEDDMPLDLDLSLAQLRNPGLAPQADAAPAEAVGASLNTGALTPAEPAIPVAFAPQDKEMEPDMQAPAPELRAFDIPTDAAADTDADVPADNPFQEPIAMTGSIPPAAAQSANTQSATTPSTYNPLAGFSADAPAPRPFAEPTAEPTAGHEPEAVQASEPQPAAPAQPQPPLEELGMVELVDRFARALKSHGGFAAAPVQTEAPAAATAPVPPPQPAPAPLAFTAPQPFVPPVTEVQAPEPQAFEPQTFEPQTFESQPAPVEAKAPAPEPARPAALTPVAFDDAEDDSAEDDSADENSDFSSLLGIRSRPASGEGFVRIDEPEDTDGGDHPVVIFPGQEARAAKLASEVGKPDNFDPTAQFGRPFDSPGDALDNAHKKTGAPENANDTERALRDALEKLQRMSGAA